MTARIQEPRLSPRGNFQKEKPVVARLTRDDSVWRKATSPFPNPIATEISAG
jgi:hypothetical protein